MSKPILVFSVAVVFGSTSACFEDTPGLYSEFEVDTVGSVPITRNLAGEPFPAPESISPKEVFRIGSASGDEMRLFSGPLINLSNGPNGQLFVLDQAIFSVRVFGPSGEFVREFGGRGRGPGELSSPSSLAWDTTGHLWIPEPFERRYSVFDSIGRFQKTVPRAFFRGVNRLAYPSTVGTFGTGAGIFRADSTGTVLDTFPVMEYPPNRLAGVVISGRDREWVNAIRDLRPRLIWTLAPDGTLWMARSDELRLIHRTLSGDTLRIIEANHRQAGFSDSEKDVVARVSGMYEDVEFSPTLIQSLHASDNGLLFVQISGELGQPGHEVDVFGERGEYLGSFSLDPPIQPLSQTHFAGGFFSYVGVGPLDVPIVTRARVAH
jgi:hypothetical protein